MSPFDWLLAGLDAAMIVLWTWDQWRHRKPEAFAVCTTPGCPGHPMDRDEEIVALPEGYVVTRAHLDDRITHELPGMRRKRD